MEERRQEGYPNLRRGGTPEQIAEAARSRRDPPEKRARRRLVRSADRLAGVLIQAALGEGDFSKLDPDKRASYAVKALEFGIGKARVGPVIAEENQETEEVAEPDGIEFL